LTFNWERPFVVEHIKHVCSPWFDYCIVAAYR
jgi:hypothetical protein